MIILAKDKDYYDYLADGKGAVLDRRNAEKFSLETMKKVVLHIGGFRFEGMFVDGKIIYGKEAIKKQKFKNIALTNIFHICNAPVNTNTSTHFYFNLEIERGGYYYYTKNSSCILKERQPSMYNDKYNCPILIWDNGFKKYPNLESLQLNKYVPSTEIYELLNNWYGDNVMANNDILRSSVL